MCRVLEAMNRVAALILLAGVGACHKDEAARRPAPSATASPVTIDLPDADAGAPIRARHPTPDAVCDHLFELATASEGAGGATLALGTREQCVQYQQRQSALSRISSCRNNVCSMRATTWSDAKRCLTRSAEEQDPSGSCNR
jgi:hypothetical protein